MLPKSLLSVIVGAAFLHICSGQCYVVSKDLNTKWRPADIVEQVAHDFYQSLALGPEDNDDAEKRFVSVFSHTLFLYVVSNKTDEADRIKDAAHRTRNKLDNAADQLAGPIRALISLALLYIEGPLTDVQIACPYYVREHDCKDTLSKLQADKMKQCPGYKDNIDLYNRGASLINSCGLENLLDELALESSKGGDMEAINLFTDFASIKAVGPDDACNRRKRFASVFSEAMLQYFNSNMTDRDEAIRDAVAKTEKELYKPADIIGSEFRAKFTYIYSFVDQPLSDIQAVCPYNIREPECEKRFKQIRNERLQLCPEYRWNVELYSTAVFLVTNCGFQNLMIELKRESATGGDLEALNFFIETAAIKFSNVLQFFKDVWKSVQLLPLTCKTISFL